MMMRCNNWPTSGEVHVDGEGLGGVLKFEGAIVTQVERVEDTPYNGLQREILPERSFFFLASGIQMGKEFTLRYKWVGKLVI